MLSTYCTICERPANHVAASCPNRKGQEDRGWQSLGSLCADVLRETARKMRGQDERAGRK